MTSASVCWISPFTKFLVKSLCLLFCFELSFSYYFVGLPVTLSCVDLDIAVTLGRESLSAHVAPCAQPPAKPADRGGCIKAVGYQGLPDLGSMCSRSSAPRWLSAAVS